MHSKKEIIRKGVDIFRKQGYHNTGISDILYTCDIPKGSFYNYFRSKEDYSISVLNYYGDSLLEFMNNKLKADGVNPVQKLKNLYSAFIEIVEKEEIKSGCLVNNMSNEVGGLNNSLAEVANQIFRKWINAIEIVAAKGQAIHEIRNDMGAREIAEYLHGTFNGLLSRMKVTRNIDGLNEWHKMTFKFLTEDKTRIPLK